MDKLSKLYTGVFVVFLVLISFILLHYYRLDEENDITDLNNDGKIDQNEIDVHIKKILDNRSKQPPQFKGIIKSMLTGVTRGALMGLLLNGIEGSITSAIVLGIINPIITSIEFMF